MENIEECSKLADPQNFSGVPTNPRGEKSSVSEDLPNIKEIEGRLVVLREFFAEMNLITPALKMDDAIESLREACTYLEEKVEAATDSYREKFRQRLRQNRKDPK